MAGLLSMACRMFSLAAALCLCLFAFATVLAFASTGQSGPMVLASIPMVLGGLWVVEMGKAIRRQMRS